MVNGSSPAFALLDDLQKLYCDRHSPYPHAISKLNKQISSLTRSVRRLLKEGAVSPYEVDENGRTLLHNALLCSYKGCALDEVPAFRELVHTLLDSGVAINEVDLAGETAFDYLVAEWDFFDPNHSQRESVCRLVANNGAEISDVLLRRSSVNGLELILELQNVAMLEPWQDATECGPLSLAVLRKCEQDVIRILRATPSSINELNRRNQNPLHLACCWPRGIQLLLDTGAYLVHQVDTCGQIPITYSIGFYCVDAIELLIKAGSAFSSPGWDGVDSEEILQVLYWKDPIPLFLLSTLQERRRKLFELAKLTLPAEVWADLDVPTDRLLDDRAAEIQRVLIDAGIEIPESISVPQRRGTVYNGVIQSAKQADQLWDAGFRDIDSPNKHGYTPIMDTGRSTGLEYAQWLLNHGADLHGEFSYVQHMLCDKGTPVAGFTKLHYVAQSLGRTGMLFIKPKLLPGPWVVSNEPIITFEELLVKNGCHDDCYCACSSGGCAPFTILLKTIQKERDLHAEASSTPAESRRLLLQQLESPGHPASSALMRSMISEKVIRFETFEALQLSHTCCDFGYYVPRRRYTPEEVQEIREEWEVLLSKHEDLVSEFCHKFQELGGTLTSFLESYWQTRMDEVLKEEKPYDEEDIRRLRELGVVLEEVPEETKETSEEAFDHEDLTDEDLTDGD